MSVLRRVIPAMALGLVIPASTALPSAASSHDVTPARASGDDRYGTAAVAMTDVAHTGGTHSAVIATGADFADALAGSGLAGQSDAALLLTKPGAVPQVTSDALEELGVDNVYVLGGKGAVGAEVVAELRSGHDVARLSGQDRYETAARVAAEVATLGDLPVVDGDPAAFLATGENFADAVTAGAPAAAASAPILLTRTDSLPDATSRAIDDLGIGHLWVVGGEAAVSADVVTDLENSGVTVERFSGANRQATAVAVARAFVRSGLLMGDVVTLARGDAFPDALTGGVTAAATSGPLLLTRTSTALGDEPAGYLADPSADISVVRAMGGTAALSRGVLEGAETVAETGSVGPAPQSWVLSPQEALTLDPDDVADFTLTAQGGGDPLPDELYVALYDCRVVDATGDRTFSDGNNSGLADGFATTEAGAAAIAVLNGEDIEDTKVVTSAKPQNGKLTFRLFSDEADCAVPVVFEDTTVNGKLDVDAQGRPTEPYNLGQVTWQ